ncbi:hypothetical protein [Vreelandella sedimenti]|uniref:hypothetical protein n=1 Tax=Vreelandella sedimenti TaxID=2729618 RepID=UPI00257CA692|nr:hypothetical protein [Halomonas sp. UBA3173]
MAFNEGTKGMLLEVIEAVGPLYISERFRPRHLQPLKHLAAGRRPLGLPDERLKVVLHLAV